MKIQCPNCGTAFTLADGAIGTDGRMVRCARCGTPWRAFAAEDVAVAVAEVLPADVLRPVMAAAGDAPITSLSDPAAFERALRPELTPHAPAEIPVLTLPSITAGRDPERQQARLVKSRVVTNRRRRSPIAVIGGPLALIAAVALTVGAVIFRGPIVGQVGDLAGLYALAGLDVNLRGLEFRGVTAARSIENGAPVLVVAGEVANVSGTAVEVPQIRLALRATGAQEVYAWSVQPDQDRLAAGATAAFRARLASPPDARDLELRFSDRRRTQTAAASPAPAAPVHDPAPAHPVAAAAPAAAPAAH